MKLVSGQHGSIVRLPIGALWLSLGILGPFSEYIGDRFGQCYLSFSGVQPDGRRPRERAPAQEEGHEAEGRRRQEEKVRSCRFLKSNYSFIIPSFSGNSNRLRRERLLGGELQVIPGCK